MLLFDINSFQLSKPMIYGGKCDNKEQELHSKHPFPRVLGYKERRAIDEGDITKVRMHSWDCC